MSDILMPALSPTMEQGKLARWHVKAGDRVGPGQVIAEIETDKATMEVEAVDEGVIESILIGEGSEGVAVNTPIARLGMGEGTAPARVIAPQPGPETPRLSAAPGIAQAAAPRDPAKATPLASRIAQSAGLALAGLSGSGPHGRILKGDVERVLGVTKAPAATHQTAPAAAATRPSLEAMGIRAGSYDLIPLDGMRRTIARRMTDSFRDVPHFPLTVDVELDALLVLREQLNGILAAEGGKASLNDMIIRACAVTLRRVPEANASYTPEGVALHHRADIAVAVAIEGGLITPIIRNADGKGIGQIAREGRDLAERARGKKLAPEEFQGGTFSVSNLGMLGVKSFSSIVNEPQGAILSVGAGEKRPVVKDGALAIATVMTCTLTCDHRAMDGATAARWVQVFKGLVEQPMGLML
jgi:pyruvate dehydrogenase E2 component (dihydrolipoamide acetyltransferase)